MCVFSYFLRRGCTEQKPFISRDRRSKNLFPCKTFITFFSNKINCCRNAIQQVSHSIQSIETFLIKKLSKQRNVFGETAEKKFVQEFYDTNQMCSCTFTVIVMTRKQCNGVSLSKYSKVTLSIYTLCLG